MPSPPPNQTEVDWKPLMGPWIAGDINHDGKVGSQDLFTLAPAYGSQRGDENWDAHADLNEHGEVGSADLSIVAANFRKWW